MTLLDTIDGCFMAFRLQLGVLSASSERCTYNITITALSVFIALVIGSIELIGLVAEKLNVTSGPSPGLARSTWIRPMIVVLFVCDMGRCARCLPGRNIEVDWTAHLRD